jgi:squalene synthase HpnC
MSAGASTRSGKTHRTENFPVASRLVRPEHRPLIMAFYDFARAADDIADDPHFAPEEKVRRLDYMEAGLTSDGAAQDNAQAKALRDALKLRGMSARHPRDLLIAFRADATKLRYADWWELMGYCAYSANPVGRFVLDAHREDEALWPASDAICSALQIINHLQDCADDYRKLNRVYIPQDRLAAHGVAVEALAGARATPALRAVVVELAERTRTLLREGRTLAADLRDRRLRLEIEVIYALAEAHLDRLMAMDPLAERAKLPRWRMGLVALGATLDSLWHGGPRSRAAEARS